MRKISAKELAKSKSISDETKKNIVTSVAATELKKSARLLKEFVQSQANAKTDNDYAKTIEKLLDNHLAALKEILKTPDINKKWEFIVTRNKAGFISKVIATQIS